AARKRIGDRAEAVGREWFAVAVLAGNAFRVWTTIDWATPLGFVMSGIGSVVNQPVQQRTQTDLRGARDGEHRTQFALGDGVVDVRQNVVFVERALFEVFLHQLIV